MVRLVINLALVFSLLSPICFSHLAEANTGRILRRVMSTCRFPLHPVDGATRDFVKEMGGNPDIHLYRILNQKPAFLKNWIYFAYSIRNDCSETSRQLRELVILRIAKKRGSSYVWSQHLKMAMDFEIEPEKIEQLDRWDTSAIYTERERAALQLTEAVMNCSVGEELYQETESVFSRDEILELVMTASFYEMVVRIADATQVPVEAALLRKLNPDLR